MTSEDPLSESSPTLRLLTLGEVRLVRPEGGGECPLRPGVLSLLAYLLAGEPGQVHRRETLIGVFWPEVPDRRARQSLRKSLHLLRRALGEEVLLTPGREVVALDPERIVCDASDLDEAWKRGDHARCIELYRGTFAAGLRGPGTHAWEEWLHFRREELRQRALAAGEALVESALAEHRLDDAVDWARRTSALDPLDERAARRVIHVLHQAGDSAAALRRFDQLHRWMWNELEVGPSPETVALAEAIRSETLQVEPDPNRVIDDDLSPRVPVDEDPRDRRAESDSHTLPSREVALTPSSTAWGIVLLAAVVAVLALWSASSRSWLGGDPVMTTVPGLEAAYGGDEDSLEDLLNALAFYEGATRERPGDPMAQAALARTGFAIGRDWPWRTDEVVRARHALQALETLAPESGVTHWVQGIAALFDTRDYDRAAQLLESAAKEFPDDPRVWAQLGEALLLQARPDAAWEALQRAEKLGGLTPELATNQGQALSLLGRNQEASQRLDRARALSPTSGLVHFAAFRAALRAGDTIRLRHLTEGPLPNDSRMWIWGPGHAAYHRGDLELADDLLALDPRIDHRHRGIVEFLMGDHESAHWQGDSLRVDAARALAAAEAADPQALDAAWLSHSHARLGVAYALMGRRNEALRHALMAQLLLPLEEDPFGGFPPVLLGMQTYMILGDTVQATELAERALRLPTPLSRSYLGVDPLLRPILQRLPEES